jgi:hypothetical protein
MARIRWSLPVAGVALVALMVSTAAAETPKEKPAGQPSAEEMAAMMAMGNPGAQHKQLEGMIGKWNATVKMFMAPGAPPDISKGVSVNEAVLGGRFIHQAYEGSFMGMAFKGMGLTGYDNTRKQFCGLWVDNMSTGMMVTYGTSSADGKSYEFKGEMPGPDGKLGPVREVVKIVSDKQHIMEMWAPGPDGKEMLMMEITYDKSM